MKNPQYFFWATYYRKSSDELHEKHADIYHGVVLDIGGRDRGRFEKPKNEVKEWLFADIEKKHDPDIVLDVASMDKIENKSIDIIEANSLFEHVYKIKKGLEECHRVLKDDGKIVITVPFLYPVHADPDDFQRWTWSKWEKELIDLGFTIEVMETMGGFFSLQGDMLKNLIKSFVPGIKHFCCLFFPLIDLLVSLDNFKRVKNNKRIGKYDRGYFIIAKKDISPRI